MKSIHNLILFALSFLCLNLNALDLSKINPNDFIGGNPYKTTYPQTQVTNVSRSVDNKPVADLYKGSSHQQALNSQISKYKSNKKSNNIVTKYRGSSHESRLDAQIRNYRPSAKENERVFGAPYRNNNENSSSKNSKLRKLIEQGILSIIVDSDGNKKIVDNR